MKNKFILSLILGIFLVGLVSAGITGYVAKGQTLSTGDVTATLQSVDRFGTATVGVTTPTGTETVQVTEGQTVTTSDGTLVTASNLRPGNLFQKARGTINVTSAKEASQISEGTSTDLSAILTALKSTCGLLLPQNGTTGRWACFGYGYAYHADFACKGNEWGYQE